MAIYLCKESSNLAIHVSTYFILFNTCRFQSLVLNSTVFHLLWIPFNCRLAHQLVGAPRTLPRCLAKTWRLNYGLVMSCHLGYLIFAILFLKYFDTTALSALLSSLVSTFYHSCTLVYINYLAAELISRRFYQPERHPYGASLRTRQRNWAFFFYALKA